MENGMHEDRYGTRIWWLDGKRHRTDGPAAEWPDGTRKWYRFGKLHREDGPAVERANGTRAWWVDGKLHREDGPAVERNDGTFEWWLNGVRHPDGSGDSDNIIHDIIVTVGGVKYKLVQCE